MFFNLTSSSRVIGGSPRVLRSTTRACLITASSSSRFALSERSDSAYIGIEVSIQPMRHVEMGGPVPHTTRMASGATEAGYGPS